MTTLNPASFGKIYDIQYVDQAGAKHTFQLGALSVIGAINSAFELRSDVLRVLRVKPADDF